MSGTIQGFNRTVDVFISQFLSPEAQSKMLADYARSNRDELIANGQAARSYQTFADGAPALSEDSVSPNGTILYRFGYLGEAVSFALDYLKGRSPVRDGDYQNSFRIGLDGRQVMPDAFNPSSMGDVREVLIWNVQPYSRKVDVQLIGGRSMSFSVQPNMFKDAALAVNRAFPGLQASRLYTVRFPGQWRRKTGDRIGRLTDSPALQIVSRF